MNDIDEKRKNTEKINFAMQGMVESAQFTIAITVGVFGILTLFFMIHMDPSVQRLESSIWTNKSTMIYGIILSIAYWALVLFGFQSYLSRRLFEGLIGYYDLWYNIINCVLGIGTIRKTHMKNGMKILRK